MGFHTYDKSTFDEKFQNLAGVQNPSMSTATSLSSPSSSRVKSTRMLPDLRTLPALLKHSYKY